MSNRTSAREGQGESDSLESGLDALQSSPEFRGPTGQHDHGHANDHFALVYESQEDQFAAAIPFVRQGLERGERCLYIAHENSREEVVAAMRARDVDVDAALESGALSIHQGEDTYLRNDTFEADETIAFLDAAIEEAAEEYEALRVTGEMSSVLQEDPEASELVRCEAKANYLFDDVDGLALCQYNRNHFPPEVIRDVINTHPLIVHDNRISHNAYYTPPSEFFGPDQPAREVDRMLGTLREQTDARTELEERQEFLRAQTDMVASTDQSFEEKLQALFELGRDRFGLELGALARVDPDDDRFEVEYVSDDHDHFEPGVELPLSETYCTAATEIRAAGSVSDPHEDGYADSTVYQEFGIRGYLGTYIDVEGGPDRTFFFVTSEPRSEEFSDDERAFVRSMGQWVSYELQQRGRERFLRESYAITSDPDLPFEQKLERLLDLGRDWFGLEMAGLNHLPSWEGRFRLEKGVGLGVDPDETLWTDPGAGCFCRETITCDAPVSRTDVRGTDWADDPIHQEFGLTTYLGTPVASGSTPYGTLWFGSRESRERPFSDTEYTFIELMGQWVSYEIERREHTQAQEELYDIAADRELAFEEKLQAVIDLGCEQFDVELGGIATVDAETDHFEVEFTNGDHDHLVPGDQYPLSETYCQAAVDDAGTCSITDPVAEEFEGKLCYDEFGVRTYLGTYLEFEESADRTFWFVSTEPREDGFSEAERTFQQLMGQWAQYELERRNREQELRERTEHLSALVETTPECIKTVAADGTLLQMNPAGLEMVEADAESDVTGESVYGLIAPEDHERFREFNERICRGEHGTLEFDIIGLEGARRHMESHAAPLSRPDGTTAQVALTRDVTEHVEREAELERTVDLLERTERIADVGGWEIDPDTQDVFWTEHLFELLEVNDGEEPPLDQALTVYHEDDRHLVEEAVEEALAAGDQFDVEVRFQTPDDEIRWLRVQGLPQTVDGEVVTLRGAAQDVTERKQRERRLEELIDRLEESNDRLEQFAYAASHDLQEPLRMVSSYLQLLDQRYEDALDEDGEEFLEFAVNGADRMREMIEGLLAYSRVETQGDPLEPLELDAVFEDVLSDLQFQIEESDAEITADDLPRVEADASQLRQVFQNLLENAITYSGEVPPRIHVSAERRGARWALSVRDEGIGIEAAEQDRIFEVFQRLHTHGEYDGTGIGLALCERILERHGGDIRVESEPGEGTTFTFTLPAA